ncbi:MAG TPA: chloride channel protein [Rhodanobacteraceae bacterium]|nr:chloride channel protein [Rhodanobacteraceae bacterium]
MKQFFAALVRPLVRLYEKWKQDTLYEGDFRPSISILKLSGMALFVGGAAAVVAWILYRLIGLVTHVAFAGQWNFDFVPPSALHAPWWVIILAPVVGGLIIGFMARYGTDLIRGHGIPEALEAILYRKSKMTAKVAVLKPISSAIAIGTGGPFGAEGPIIMTAGAVGSLFAQAFYLTSIERRTLLVAGACAGMAATFSTPIAATLVGVEMLLFELRPRSTIPVAIACFVASSLRPFLIGPGPLFPIAIQFHLGIADLGMAAVSGFFAGLLATLVTTLVYGAEDLYNKLPVHWMWWPAIGALVVGIGGVIDPQTLGVGYGIIDQLLNGKIVGIGIVVFLLVKAVIWITYLSSGTSGGTLAPLLALGAGLGGLEALVFPGPQPLLWPLLGMGAMLAAVMRMPFTSILFAVELTGNSSVMPALLVTCTAAYGTSVFLMKRSILTEKVARHGLDIFRPYTVNRLEHMPVKGVMNRDVLSVPADLSVRELADRYFGVDQKYRAYPVVDAQGGLLNMVDRSQLQAWLAADPSGTQRLADIIERDPVVAYPEESCKSVAIRAAVEKLARVPIVSRENRQLLGMVTRYDLLNMYAHDFDEEHLRERFFRNGRKHDERPQKP